MKDGNSLQCEKLKQTHVKSRAVKIITLDLRS
jgi:hypothetical protein